MLTVPLLLYASTVVPLLVTAAPPVGVPVKLREIVSVEVSVCVAVAPVPASVYEYA